MGTDAATDRAGTNGRFCKLPLSLAARSDLTPTAKLLYAIIGDRIGGNGRAWPGMRSLARDVGVSRGAILRAIRELEDRTLLVVERRGSGLVNRYRISTGIESVPVSNQYSGGTETVPEPVSKRYRNQKDSRTRPKKTRRARRADPVEKVLIPPELDTPTFRKAWGRWIVYRKEIRKKLAKSTAEGQLNNKLLPYGPEMAAKMIQQSIDQGWIGLQPLKDGKGAKGQFTPAPAIAGDLSKVSRSLGEER